MRASKLLTLVGTALLLGACSAPPPPPDALCDRGEVQPGGDTPDGQGAILVDGRTDAYFYVRDAAGKDVDHALLGDSVAVPPGDYVIELNKTSHPVTVVEDGLVQCATATLQVKGTTDEYWYAEASTGASLNHALLGASLSFFPGSVVVSVNKTSTKAELARDVLTTIATGTLLVAGTTDEYWYATDGQGRALNHALLGRPLAFLPGAYQVSLNKTELPAKVTAGAVTTLTSGTLLVRGSTDEYWYATDATGNALNHALLGKPLAFFPGVYRVEVNKTAAEAAVVAGKPSFLETGSLTRAGSGDEYFYVSDATGNALNHALLGKPLSFFPGAYTVKSKDKASKATVVAGQHSIAR